eukprot:8357032-Pyramimonas_sp.AAC.1
MWLSWGRLGPLRGSERAPNGPEESSARAPRALFDPSRKARRGPKTKRVQHPACARLVSGPLGALLGLLGSSWTPIGRARSTATCPSLSAQERVARLNLPDCLSRLKKAKENLDKLREHTQKWDEGLDFGQERSAISRR